MSGLSSAAQARGDFAAGSRYVYEILPVAERSGLAMQQGVLLNVAAMSEAALGKHEAAIDLARRARTVLSVDSLEAIYSSLAEGQASLTIRDYAGAGAAEKAMRVLPPPLTRPRPSTKKVSRASWCG